ncbi:epoxide hydrolase [Pelagibacteraceae bacterium]|nr:epoxide hydrolase [Pelagibacteraceae bacterium]
MIRPFKLNVPESILKEINNKVKNYPWHEMPDNGGWEYGTNLEYMKDISSFWINKFDWRKHEVEINKFSNFKTNVDGIEMHFIQEKGSGSNPKPLLITHGWPGSIIEILHIIDRLAHPEKFGGNKEDSFDVIVPSLPGFGFSSRPANPIGPRKIAEILNNLMTKNLGYKNYIAQGGDWGATISNWIAYDHHRYCDAIHINFLSMRLPDGPQTSEEKKWEDEFVKGQEMEEGYRTQQATRPQTLSYGMMDSPVGVAAWILEKIYSWSDLSNNRIESVYSKDILLANIMVYLVTKTFNTSSWIYYGRREEGGRFFPKNFKQIKIPTAIAIFPAEMSPWPPKSYLDRMFNIKRFTKMPKGGHFAALEQPDLLVNDIIDFYKSIK